MKKEFVGVLILICLVFFGGAVSASMALASGTNDNKPDYDIEITINQGWNLVVLSPVWGYGDSPGAIKEDSEIKQEHIRAAFYYSRQERKYIQVYPSSEVEDYLRVAQNNQNEITYFAQSPVWIYSDKAGVLKYFREDFQKFDSSTQLALTSGWNFVTISPDMKGHLFNEFKGTCNIQKMCVFQRNNWDCVDGGVGGIDQDSEIGFGFIIKVSSDCTLGSTSSNVNPPSLPGASGVGVSSCTDSDGGTVVDTKGSVTYSGGIKEDSCADGTSVIEYDCDTDKGNVLRSNTFDCSDMEGTGFSSCQNGRCV